MDFAIEILSRERSLLAARVPGDEHQGRIARADRHRRRMRELDAAILTLRESATQAPEREADHAA